MNVDMPFNKEIKPNWTLASVGTKHFGMHKRQKDELGSSRLDISRNKEIGLKVTLQLWSSFDNENEWWWWKTIDDDDEKLIIWKFCC